MNTNSTFRVNNFDLLRLLAATQVAIWHTMEHLQIPVSPSIGFLIRLFPGVPIFFFISGFLISRSYESNPALPEYSSNRVFRIYPGLLLCSGLSLIALYATGYLATVEVSAMRIITWFFGQITIVQFYNPDFLRKFGVGVVNGSLWTIAVELQFYVMIPIVYKIFGLSKQSKKQTWILYTLIFCFMIINIIFQYYHTSYSHMLEYKLIGVTFLPWFYMFLLGVLFQKNFIQIFTLLRNKGIVLILVYVLIATLAVKRFDYNMGNNINVVLFLLLACSIFSIAYTFSSISRTLFNGNDISYGIYIYHMPIVNIFIYCNLGQSFFALGWILACTFILSSLSWFLVEKPFLRLKRHPLNPLK